MQEGISYLAGVELPAVIVDVVRGEPGLGNIASEQSDYAALVKGGHGKIVTLSSLQPRSKKWPSPLWWSSIWRTNIVTQRSYWRTVLLVR